jgi:hypothetical protein
MEHDRRIRAAAIAVKDLYEWGGKLTEWTCLDGEEFLDDYFRRYRLAVLLPRRGATE